MGSRILANNLATNTNTDFDARGGPGTSKLEGLEVVLSIDPDISYDGTVTMQWSNDGTNWGAFGSTAGGVANANLSATAYNFASIINGRRVTRFICPPYVRMVTASRTAGGVTATLTEA